MLATYLVFELDLNLIVVGTHIDAYVGCAWKIVVDGAVVGTVDDIDETLRFGLGIVVDAIADRFGSFVIVNYLVELIVGTHIIDLS